MKKYVTINRQQYIVENNEYDNYVIKEYENLKFHKNIGQHERIVGLLKRIQHVFDIKNALFCDITHGGFIPIQCNTVFDIMYIHNDDIHYTHTFNVLRNCANLKVNNISILSGLNAVTNLKVGLIYIDHNNIGKNYYKELKKYITSMPIILSCDDDLDEMNSDKCYFKYKLANSQLCIYVPANESHMGLFEKSFKIRAVKDESAKVVNYDNLLNMCIMVKNGGEQFENMLKHNMKYADRWTILDTGSTDNTISVIKNTLSNNDGNLYEEPFINFRDSRNKLLDYASNDCKYTIMLDDTYLIKGDIRAFLQRIRDDQYADSFTLYIKSDDVEYGSNRILKTSSNLRYIYKIHEVVTSNNNKNIIIPTSDGYILDGRFDYMEKRTMDRKQFDLKLLYEEMKDDPHEPRHYYYIAQTYNLLGNYEKAFEFFVRRGSFVNSGFNQERVDALFEAARLANFKLNLPWEQCEALYEKCFMADDSRPESLYFIGIHHYMENNHAKAHYYFKRAFEIGYPVHCQYSLKPTLSFHFLPKFLCRICFGVGDFSLGKMAGELFLLKNDMNADDYQEVLSWYKIYVNLTLLENEKSKMPKQKLHIPDKPIFCFIADGGFKKWSGSSILNEGVGGSETYIIETARHIQRSGHYNVYVFCNCENDEVFEDVNYMQLEKMYRFMSENYVNTCMVSRYSEYLPTAYHGNTENVYLIVHDLSTTGIVIPRDKKLKAVFCLTEWHVEYFTNIFPTLKDITVSTYYGCNLDTDIDTDAETKGATEEVTEDKDNNIRFIYSSFPNRGLYELLCAWETLCQWNSDLQLDIYCDLDNEWVNSVEPEKMKLVKKQLQLLINNGFNVTCHGWVNKKVLSDAWKKADVWFYPCTFAETFCLTALECAKSKTLAICNDLGALRNTVCDRGIMIRGDASNEKWMNEAIDKIKIILSPHNKSEREYLIEKNYQWACEYTWERQTDKLLTNYFLQNKYEYKGYYNWTNDYPEGCRNAYNYALNVCFSSLKNPYRDLVHILEIGTNNGTSIDGMLSFFNGGIGHVIDTWDNDYTGIEKSFEKNIGNRIGFVVHKEKPHVQLMNYNGEYLFNVIHILKLDHNEDIYMNATLSWNILKPYGMLIIYEYTKYDKKLIDRFLNDVENVCEIVQYTQFTAKYANTLFLRRTICTD